jgi:hypothetical protein
LLSPFRFRRIRFFSGGLRAVHRPPKVGRPGGFREKSRSGHFRGFTFQGNSNEDEASIASLS